MSKKVEIEASCPFCGFNQTVTFYSSVNVSLEPELRVKIFEDEINQFVCLHCGKNCLISADLLYHDMDHKFAVWFCPKGEIPEEEKKMSEKIIKAVGLGDYLIKAPITYSWDEFKKKILEFEKQKRTH
ncbi:MAG: hypothetical protein GTO17_04450 [Candidatus Aminicenantes bacterium]|nr:hypothetical protein [Candidatus Aminicenantes bacterium]